MTKVAREELTRLSDSIKTCNVIYMPQVLLAGLALLSQLPRSVVGVCIAHVQDQFSFANDISSMFAPRKCVLSVFFLGECIVLYALH